VQDQQDQLRLGDLGNPDWYTNPAETALLVVGYRMMLVDDEAPMHHMVDMGWIRAHMLLASLPYWDGGGLIPKSATEWDVQSGSLRRTSSLPHLVLATPTRVDGVQVPEPTYRERISDALGLLIAWQGLNVAYAPVMELEAAVAGNKVIARSGVVVNPMSMRAPVISGTQLAGLDAMARAVASLDEHLQNRVRLSLRWFERANRSTGTDSFLQFWIAIETLAMPDTTNIKALAGTLAGHYRIAQSDAMAKYGIGRLYGLRGRIVHDGERPPLSGALLDLVAAIYVDALNATLATPAVRRADEVLAKAGARPLDGI